MKRIFRTQVDEIEIIKELLKYNSCEKELKSNNCIDFLDLLKKNVYYRYKCKMANLNNIISQEQQYSRIALEHASKDSQFRRCILEQWAIIVPKIVGISEDKDALNNKINSYKENNNCSEKERFLFICYLWLKDNEEFNKEGDKLYTLDRYNERSVIEDKKEKRTSNMQNNPKEDMMTLSIGDLIKSIINLEENEKRFKCELEEKDKEIIKLKKQLDIMLDNRELKKELKESNKKILNIESTIKNGNGVLNEEIIELRKNNDQFINLLEKTNKYIKDNVANEISKDIKDKQKDMNNSLKGIIVDTINKNNKVVVKEIQKIIEKEISCISEKLNTVDDIDTETKLVDDLFIRDSTDILNSDTRKTIVEDTSNDYDIDKIIKAIKG